jgi:hypothetical protein
MSERRPLLTTLSSLIAPPFTVASLAVIRHSTPDTTPMPPDDARAGRVAADLVARERCDLEEVAALVEQTIDALARQELACLGVAVVVLGAPARSRLGERRIELREAREVRVAVLGELLAPRVHARREDRKALARIDGARPRSLPTVSHGREGR